MLLKPDYYKSTTLFYPVNSSLLEPVSNRTQSAPGYYGNDHDVDRILSIGSSNELILDAIATFNLAEHYEINIVSTKGKNKVRKRFKKNYNIKKTAFDAIQINVEDTDPAIATQIVKHVRNFINNKARALAKSSQNSMMSSLQISINAKSKELKIVTDTIRFLRQKHGIYDTRSQGEALATLEIKSGGSAQIRKKIENYNSGISDIIKLEIRQASISKNLATSQNELSDITAAFTHNSSALHIIEEASIPLEKSRPRRSLYVLGSIILVTGLAKLIILALTYSDKYIRETNA